MRYGSPEVLLSAFNFIGDYGEGLLDHWMAL